MEFENSRITFGLSQSHIDHIEIKLNNYIHRAEFSPFFWIEVAKELGWDALTLALWYFKHLDKNGKQTGEQDPK
jgi:hypothetical protein